MKKSKKSKKFKQKTRQIKKQSKNAPMVFSCASISGC